MNQLKEVKGLAELTNLVHLTIDDCSALERPPFTFLEA
jgi:hypothetical protein